MRHKAFEEIVESAEKKVYERQNERAGIVENDSTCSHGYMNIEDHYEKFLSFGPPLDLPFFMQDKIGGNIEAWIEHFNKLWELIFKIIEKFHSLREKNRKSNANKRSYIQN